MDADVLILYDGKRGRLGLWRTTHSNGARLVIWSRVHPEMTKRYPDIWRGWSLYLGRIGLLWEPADANA